MPRPSGCGSLSSGAHFGIKYKELLRYDQVGSTRKKRGAARVSQRRYLKRKNCNEPHSLCSILCIHPIQEGIPCALPAAPLASILVFLFPPPPLPPSSSSSSSSSSSVLSGSGAPVRSVCALLDVGEAGVQELPLFFVGHASR